MANLKEAMKIFSESGSEEAIFWKEGRGWKSAVYPIPCFPRESAEKIIQADPNAIVSYLYGSMADTELQIKQNYGREEYLLSAKLAEIEAMPPVFKWKVSRNTESYNCRRQTRPLRRGEPEHTGVFEFAGAFDTREEASEYADKLNNGERTAEEVREESAEKRRRARAEAEVLPVPAEVSPQEKAETRDGAPAQNDMSNILYDNSPDLSTGKINSGWKIIALGRASCVGYCPDEPSPYVCWSFDDCGGAGTAYHDTLKRALKVFMGHEIANAREPTDKR
jgi:hypothetical protein